jgi:hypothetical protein
VSRRVPLTFPGGIGFSIQLYIRPFQHGKVGHADRRRAGHGDRDRAAQRLDSPAVALVCRFPKVVVEADIQRL